MNISMLVSWRKIGKALINAMRMLENGKPIGINRAIRNL